MLVSLFLLACLIQISPQRIPLCGFPPTIRRMWRQDSPLTGSDPDGATKAPCMRLWILSSHICPIDRRVQQTFADQHNAANVEEGKKVEAGHISGLSRAKAACNGLHPYNLLRLLFLIDFIPFWKISKMSLTRLSRKLCDISLLQRLVFFPLAHRDVHAGNCSYVASLTLLSL